MMSLLRNAVKFIVAALAFASICNAQLPDLRLTQGSKYVQVRGVQWASFNRTYVMVPLQPEVGVCIYVANNNPTNNHTFTLAVFQTADGAAQDFTNNVGRFKAVNLSNLTANQNVGTLATVTGFSATTAAAEIAFQFTAAAGAGGSPDTADIFFVQTTSNSCGAAPSALPVTGLVQQGQPVNQNGNNPLVIAGMNGTSTNSAVTIPNVIAFGNLGQNFNGWAIGDGGIGPGGTYGAVTLPDGANGGPMADFLMACNNGVALCSQAAPVSRAGNSNAGNETMFLGLSVKDTGYSATATTTVTTNTNVNLWNRGAGTGGFTSCRIDVNVTGVSGTTPTLDIWIQDGFSFITLTDRVHFTQFTAAGSAWFSITANAASSATSHVYQNHTLAANAIIDGPMGPTGQIQFVVGGTTPSFTLSWAISCT